MKEETTFIIYCLTAMLIIIIIGMGLFYGGQIIDYAIDDRRCKQNYGNEYFATNWGGCQYSFKGYLIQEYHSWQDECDDCLANGLEGDDVTAACARADELNKVINNL